MRNLYCVEVQAVMQILLLQISTCCVPGLWWNASGNITSAQLTTDFILDERGRELYYEAQRRTDLIRYGKFTTGTYLWAWKGGVGAGRSVDKV